MVGWQPRKTCSAAATLLLILFVIVPLIFDGCSKKHGTIIGNTPPGIELTHGPIENSWEAYTVEFFWTGWDDDGVVDYFLWAIDDTSSARAWTRTYLNRGIFPFPSTTALSSDTTVFTSYHTFFVRAVDDDGAMSEPATLSFNSTTFAPYSEIEMPEEARNPWGQAVSVGSAVRISWSGTDPDGITACPVGYMYRVVQVPVDFALRPPLMKAAVADSSTVATYPWRYLPGDSTAMNLRGLVSHGDVEPKLYVFCVKAIDEAGAIEPFYRFGDNVIVIQAHPRRDGPGVTIGIEEIAEFSVPAAWGKRVPPPSHGGASIEVPVGATVKFYWRGDTGGLVGRVAGYRFALDIDNINDDAQWSPWSLNRTSVEYTFGKPGAGQHHFYFQAKDDGGGVSFVIFDFTVVAFDFDKTVLFVDDLVNTFEYGMQVTTEPSDELHDACWRQFFASAGLVEGTDDGYTMWDAWNYEEPEKRQCYIPPLEVLNRYKAVVWLTSTRWAAYTAYNRAVANPWIANVIGSYVAGGGRLWLLGRGTIRYSFPHGWSMDRDYVRLNSLVSDNFAYRFLHIRDTIVRWSRGADSNWTGLFAARSASGRYPHLSLDIMPGGRFWEAHGRFRALGNVEAIASPMRATGVDTMYYYYAHNGRNNMNYGRPCGTRWRHPEQRGEAIWFGFPLYYFEPQQSEELVRVMMKDLLRP
jgi:hypothetical protein